MTPLLTHFVSTRPACETEQAESLAWLARIHADAETVAEGLDAIERMRFMARMEKALRRVACSPDKIRARGHAVADLDGLYDVRRAVHGPGSAERTAIFAQIVDAYFADAYADEAAPPDDIVHVTCTGYASPNGAQKLVARRGWGGMTRVTNAYQMGCYAALPALRIAGGFVATGSARVDVVHTELCSLHLDPAAHALEQLVVQSLFADGLIRFCVVPDQGTRGLRVLALHERVLPDTSEAMGWVATDTGMQMNLSRVVPERVASALRGFVTELLAKCGRAVTDLAGSVVAVHPGGPKIIDRVRDVLELSEAQVAASRGVLADYGNMSSATLPHIWERLLEDPAVAPGTLIPSLAFGPGLTVCGGVLEKR